MLAPQNQDLRQILIHLPCLAVRCPVLRELIGVPYFSGLTANFPPSKRLFLQKNFVVCVYICSFPHFHNSKNRPSHSFSMALTAIKKTSRQDWSCIYSISLSGPELAHSSSQPDYQTHLPNCRPKFYSPLKLKVLLLCDISYHLTGAILSHFRIKFDN